MIISLDEQIKKDKDNQYYKRRDRRDSFKHRRTYNYNHGYQENFKKSYAQKVFNYNKKKNYQDKYSPQKKQRSAIKISNLHYSVDKERLETICGSFGKLKTCRIDWDKMGRSNETATIEFFNRQDQEKAIKQLNGMFVQGQQIKVEQMSQFSPLNLKKHHQITKPYNKYPSNKYQRRG